MEIINFIPIFLISINAFSLEYGECNGTEKAHKNAVKKLGVFTKELIERQGDSVKLSGEYSDDLIRGIPAELLPYHNFFEPSVGIVFSWCHLPNENPNKFSEIIESCSYEISSEQTNCKVLRYEFVVDKTLPNN